MNSMETMLFPNTTVFKRDLYPLLLFCSPLQFLQVVENGLPQTIDDDPQPFLEHGLVHPHRPAPLASNRGQFLDLIDKIEKDRENIAQDTDYVAGDIGSAGVSSLIDKYASRLAVEEGQRKLLQAQLILTIAELLDSEEEALRENLSVLDRDEIDTIQVLQEKSSEVLDLFDNLDSIKAQLENPRPGNVALRFEAWLYILRQGQVPQVDLWLASSQESAEELFKHYRSSGKGDEVPLLKLAMPARFMESPKYAVQQIEKFHKATTTIHQGLVADFNQVAMTREYERGAVELLLPYQTDWAAQWEVLLYEFFPESSYGRTDITFYLLPEQRAAELLSLPRPVSERENAPFHEVVAVLNRKGQ